MTTVEALEPIVGSPANPKDFSGTTELGIHTVETEKRHVFGRRAISWDGRVHKYALAGGTLNTDLLAQSVVAQHVAYATVAASTDIGATELIIDVAGTDGASADGVIAENELEGGYVIIFPHSENSMNRLIMGNSAVATGECTLTLDGPLNVATVVDVTHAECMASPYSSIKASTAGDPARSFVALPVTPATSGQYCWSQTWGPCWVAPDNGSSSVDVGNTDHNNAVVARYNGSIEVHGYADALNTLQQHVGFIMSRATAGTQGAPFIMLQISI